MGSRGSFDLDGPYLLRCEMARKNMYIGMKDADLHSFQFTTRKE